jgi:hypothetical protein
MRRRLNKKEKRKYEKKRKKRKWQGERVDR